VALPEILGTEVMDDGRPAGRPPRRWPHVSGVVLLALVVLGYGLGQWLQGRAETDVRARADGIGQAIALATDSLRSDVIYLYPLIYSSDVPAERAWSIAGPQLTSTAARQRARIAAARDQLAATRPMPWQDDLEAARLAVLRHADAWLTFLDRVQAEPRQMLVLQPDVAAARSDAQQALAALAQP